MQNCASKPFVALRLAQVGITADRVLLTSEEYEQICTLEAAKEQIATLLEQANQEIANIHEKARQEGLAQGIKDAQNLALDQVAQMQESMSTWVKHTDTAIIDIVNRCVQEVVDKVDTTTLVAHSVEKGLAELASANQIIVRVHPSRKQAIDTQVEQMAIDKGITGQILVNADGSLQEADVVVESAIGTVDLRLQNQLQLITKALSA